jgi:transcriptional regulator with XRE-family HTH domain
MLDEKIAEVGLSQRFTVSAVFGKTAAMVALAWAHGDVIRKIRETRGWTLGQLASRTDPPMHRTTVSDLEGGSNAERATLERVARALGVTVGDFYSGIPVSFANELERRAHQLFSGLETERQQRMLVLLEEEAAGQAAEAIEGAGATPPSRHR